MIHHQFSRPENAGLSSDNLAAAAAMARALSGIDMKKLDVNLQILSRSSVPVIRAAHGRSGCGSPLLPGCGHSGHYGVGITDLAGGVIVGYQQWGKYTSESGRMLANAASLSEDEASLAGKRMAYLRWNLGAQEAGEVGDSGLLQAGGYVGIGVGGALTVLGYHAHGYGWDASIAKGIVVTGFSAGGAYLGGAVGVSLGSLVPGFDLTGLPEVGGAVLGSAVGGWAGGEVGSFLANLIPNF